MAIGPLEYLVIGMQDNQFIHTVLPELHALHGDGSIRVIDLLFVHKQADGTATTQEVRDLREEDLQHYRSIVGDLTGLLTAEDVAQLVGKVPPSTSAVIVLFEHTWVLGLTDAVQKAGGVFFTGGMVSPEALQHVSAELAAEEARHA